MSTSVTVRELRCRIVVALPRLAGWQPGVLAIAIADLVADGLLTETGDGRLCVRARGAA